MDKVVQDRLKTNVRIVALVPESIYLDKTYTQLVLVEFLNGKRVFAYDVMSCTNNMIGTKKDVILTALTLELERGVISKFDIISDQSGPISKFFGIIEELVKIDMISPIKDYDAIINFGIGKISINIDKKYSNLDLKRGDFVGVTCHVELATCI
jgi:hypothetical protein